MAIKTKSSTPKVEKKSMICKNGCSNKPKAMSNFYESNLEEYKVYGGYVPICKICLRKMAIDTTANTVTMDSLKYVLKRVDKPFIEEVWDVTNKTQGITNSTFLGHYLKNLNCYPKYRGLVYADTIGVQIEQEKIMNSKIDEAIETKVTEEIKRFWGRGLETQDYIDLQAMFDGYTINEKSMTKKKQEDYKNLCIYELQKSKIHFDLDRIADTQKLQGLIDNLSSSLGIQAVQKMEDDKNERFTLGLLARYHEDILKRPIRRFVEDLGGVDPIQKKIEVYYKGGILNAMGIQNPDIEKYREEVERYTVKLKHIEEEIAKEKVEGDIDG